MFVMYNRMQLSKARPGLRPVICIYKERQLCRTESPTSSSFARWPGKFEAGKVLNGIVTHQEWLPTVSGVTVAARGLASLAAPTAPPFTRG